MERMAADTAEAVGAGKRRLLGLGLVVAAVTLVLDHVTKFVILQVVAGDLGLGSLAAVRDATLHGNAGWRVPVTDFFNLVMVWNRGVSFGLFSGADARWVLVAVSLVVVAVLTVWLRRADNPLLAVGLGMVIGGAIGNVIDRLWHGAVVDFLDFYAYGEHWPAFNVADSGICVGVGLLLLDSFRSRPDTKSQR